MAEKKVDKVDCFILLFTTSMTIYIISPLNIVLGAEEGTRTVIIILHGSTIPDKIFIHSPKPVQLAKFMDHCIISIMCAWYYRLISPTTTFTVAVPKTCCDPAFDSPSACTRSSNICWGLLVFIVTVVVIRMRVALVLISTRRWPCGRKQRGGHVSSYICWGLLVFIVTVVVIRMREALVLICTRR